MNDPQRASISHALQVYRDVVLKQNLETVRYLIAEAEPRPASLPAYCNTDEKIQTARIRLFRERYGILHPDLIHVEDIREYIFGDEEVLGEIIEVCRLDPPAATWLYLRKATHLTSCVCGLFLEMFPRRGRARQSQSPPKGSVARCYTCCDI